MTYDQRIKVHGYTNYIYYFIKSILNKEEKETYKLFNIMEVFSSRIVIYDIFFDSFIIREYTAYEKQIQNMSSSIVFNVLFILFI